MPDCPAYIPVLCGAIFDKSINPHIQGDNTGDNISQKRQYYSEFTVQYWAWKNTSSDYVGLCHYRRYFSFSDRLFKAKKYDRMVHAPALYPKTINRFGITDHEKILEIVQNHDAVIPIPINVKQLPTMHGIRDTVGEMWDAYTGFSNNSKSFSQIVIDYVERLAPKYLETARSYLNGEIHHGFNCYVMKRSLFNEMCEFQFPIMKQFEEDCNAKDCLLPERTVGYLGEALNGIFIHYLLTVKNISHKKLQLVFFRDTRKYNKKPIKQYIKFYLGQLFDTVLSFFFPRGSKRRQRLKKLFRQ
jgi:hypothetical protein